MRRPHWCSLLILTRFCFSCHDTLACSGTTAILCSSFMCTTIITFRQQFCVPRPLWVLHNPRWEVLGVVLISLGGWSVVLVVPVLLFCWILVFCHEILWNSNQFQDLWILVVFGGTLSICMWFVVFIQFRVPYLLQCEILVLFPLAPPILHALPKEVEFMPQNFRVSLSYNEDIVHPLQNMEVCLWYVLL